MTINARHRFGGPHAHREVISQLPIGSTLSRADQAGDMRFVERSGPVLPHRIGRPTRSGVGGDLDQNGPWACADIGRHAKAYGFVDDACGTGLLVAALPGRGQRLWTDFAAHRVAHRASPSPTSSTGQSYHPEIEIKPQPR